MPKAKVSDIDMFYEEVGDGPPLLLTTGWALAERAFVQHRQLFAEQYRCIRHDHRGMGRSDAPKQPYTIEQLADDLAGLLDHLGIERSRVLGGGGMGGLVAMELAIRHPDRVTALHLGAPSLKVDNFLAGVMDMWKDLRRLDPELWAREVTFWCYTPQTFNEQPGLSDAGARARAGEQTFPDPTAFDRIVDAYKAYDATDRAGRIRCPTLITCGDVQDLITGPRFAQAVNAAIPDSELRILKGTSHNYWVERQEEWGQLILNWFARHGDR